MHIRTKGQVFCCAMLIALQCGFAQQTAPPPPATPADAPPPTPALAPAPGAPAAPVSGRPKLGIVLEGGGALGLAHIGVLQWMEEHHIPISYVAGTSMGGLVGGIYSTGESAADVRATVATIQWDDVLRGVTPFNDLAFRRKEDEHEYPSSLEFGLKGGLQFPAGFNTGQQVSLILDRVALPYSDLASFNELPIPFACVATDLVSGKPHVFRSGQLGLALRSTMSLPGLFSPVRDGDHIYADGGLLNNIPIDVAKSMGADVVLGIHLETAPMDPKEQLSSFGVLGRSISVMIAANELRSMENADLLVTVPLQPYTALDYDKADEIIKLGYEAAAGKAKVLMVYSVSDAEWAAYIAERNARRRTAPIPQFVTAVSPNDKANKAIEKQSAGFVGKPIDTAKLDQEMLDIQGIGEYANLTYNIVEKNGQPGLEITADQKPYAPPIVRPIILIDGSDYNDVLFSMGARVTFFNFGSYRSELRNDIILGSQYGLDSEYYHPFTPISNWFVAPRVGVYSTAYPIYNNDSLVASYRQRSAGGGLDIGYEFGRSGELRLGYEGGYQKLSKEIGSPTILPSVEGASADARAQFEFNQLDDPVLPRAGEYAKFDGKYYSANPGAPNSFPLFEGEIEKFFRLNDINSVFVIGQGGTSFNHNAGVPAFSLGGSLRLVAYNTNELLTDQYYLGQLGYLRRLAKLPPFLGDSLNFIGLFEAGKTYQLPLTGATAPPDQPGDVAAGLIVNTIFGPVEAAYAVGNYDRHRFFFRIGRIF